MQFAGCACRYNTFARASPTQPASVAGCKASCTHCPLAQACSCLLRGLQSCFHTPTSLNAMCLQAQSNAEGHQLGNGCSMHTCNGHAIHKAKRCNFAVACMQVTTLTSTGWQPNGRLQLRLWCTTDVSQADHHPCASLPHDTPRSMAESRLRVADSVPLILPPASCCFGLLI